MTRATVGAVYLLVGMFLGSSALAEVPKSTPAQGDALQAVLDRIRTHAANDAWQRDGWTDDAIDAYVEKLLATVAVGTGRGNLRAPVKTVDVRPRDPNQRRGFGDENVLVVGHDLKLTGPFRRCLILSDGCVSLQLSAEECVIIARHAIVSSNTHKCVLVAGSHIDCDSDGNSDTPNGTDGSIIVTRGRLNLMSSGGSVLAAGDGIRVGVCQKSTFLNSGIQGLDVYKDSKSVSVPLLTLEPPTPHPLAAKITALGSLATVPRKIVEGNKVRPTGLVFRMDGQRHVASVGEPIADDSGKPVESLRGWLLTYASDQFAVLRNGEAEAFVRIEEK